ncbi:MAG: hypothetical protein ACOCPM_01640 [Bacteroidales bacterium]
MKINRNNYEVYMIDYLDGNLTPGQIDELMLFLNENPDIKAEAEGLDITVSPKDEQSPVYDEKAALKQPVTDDLETINENNYETWFIAFVEGNLSKDEESRLNTYITQNPEKQKELELFKATKLHPEEIVFDNKSQLKSIAIIPVAGIDATNYEQKMVAWLENDLSPQELKDFNGFIEQNPGIEQELKWLKKTKLQKNNEIVFPDKRQLKQFYIGFSRKTAYSFVAAAAAVALLIGFSWNSLFPPQQIETGLANLDRKNIEVKEDLKERIKTKSTDIEKAKSNVSDAGQKSRATSTTTPEREDVSQLNMLASNDQTTLQVRNELNIDPDYRVYISNAQLLNRHRKMANDNLMMAMQDNQGVLSVQDIAWNQLENWTGVEKTDDFNSDKKNIFWTLVDVGLQGVNSLTGSELELKRKVTDDGDLEGYTFQSNAFKVSRSR